MRNPFAALVVSAAILSASVTGPAQDYQPHSIQFIGAPEYSDQELLAAAQLKPGMSLSVDAMKDHARILLDSGVFDNITFQFTGVDLRYILTPSTTLLPIRLANLPLAPGKDLDAQLHDKVALYRGKVPADSGLTDQVRVALEQILAAQGIKATVIATPVNDLKQQKIEAVSYAIVDPPVKIGAIHMDESAAEQHAEILPILANLTGMDFDSEGSPNQIATNLGNYYKDKGYLEANIQAEPQIAAAAQAEAIRIPFRVAVSRGALYKLTGIELTSGLLVSQADFDRQSQIQPGLVATSKYVRQNLHFIERQYHNKGYVKADIHATPSFDRAQSTARFVVTVDPGPVYTMGKLTIENVSDEFRAPMLAAWKIPAGTTFNEGAILPFCSIAVADLVPGRASASVECKYVLHLNDEARTVDVNVWLEKKH